jgi:hypothetical protein
MAHGEWHSQAARSWGRSAVCYNRCRAFEIGRSRASDSTKRLAAGRRSRRSSTECSANAATSPLLGNPAGDLRRLESLRRNGARGKNSLTFRPLKGSFNTRADFARGGT